MATRDRIKRHKTTGGAASLVRAEVLVPPGDGQKIIEADEIDRLFNEAVTRYGKRCLWNVDPQPTSGGMRVIADKLRKHGDMEAWKLATRIRKAIASATG